MGWPVILTIHRIQENNILHKKVIKWIHLLKEAKILKFLFLLSRNEISDIKGLEGSIQALRKSWYVYIYVYVYIHVCKYICRVMYRYIYIYFYVCIYSCIRMCRDVYIYIHANMISDIRGLEESIQALRKS
jgi:hypothetical protein